MNKSIIKNRSAKDKAAYSKLENDLRRMIQNGELAIDRAISSENELAESYGISRNSTRKALQILVDEGLLRKVHGKGTFVAPPSGSSSAPNKLKVVFILKYPKNEPQIESLISGGLAQAYIENCEVDFLFRDETDFDKLLSQYKSSSVNGVIWDCPSSDYYAIIEKYRDAGIPQVTINRSIPRVPSIFFDAENIFKETINILQGIGHRKIALIDQGRTEAIFRLRQNIFLSEMRKVGIKSPENYLHLFRTNDITHQPLAEVESLKKGLSKVTAVILPFFVVDEFLAYCAEKAIRIPEDISLVSLSDENAPELRSNSDISAMIDPRREIAGKAVELIMSQNRGDELSPAPVKIKGYLIMSKTCASPEYLLRKLS
jgi:DNA-binding LacI/PurR family transcriptional regulator